MLRERRGGLVDDVGATLSLTTGEGVDSLQEFLGTEFFACRAANTNSPAVLFNEIMLRLSDLAG